MAERVLNAEMTITGQARNRIFLETRMHTPPRRFSYSLLALAFLVGPVQVSAQKRCTPKKFAAIEAQSGLNYDIFRKKIIALGWQPAMINPTQRKMNAGTNMEPMLKAGFDEVTFCSGTGLAICEFEFTDVYGNHLIVETSGEVWEKNPFPTVSKYYFKC